MYIQGGNIMKVAKWGNSLAIRLPASLVEILELREGDDIEIVVDDPRTFAVCKKPGSEVLLERLRTFRGKLPTDFKFSRDEANGRG
ncbi:AbrB/MazE/SpoVT family DNA-binding domain-containing protein [Photorhabdus africana]|uniref:AbrB/MazE/SpoVT family DNA-binding domain-containing protein n=2 Tax=Photorhabdus TaxID=29487 RepID=UPI002B40B3F4|nr:AbrB/MazE/SpoVT family DNA-binding domain-containing protein [Photorhabdus sp. CRI-LC]